MGRIQRTKVFKLVAVLLVIVMIITSIPVGVYAGQIGGINTGSSTAFGNPSRNPASKFGDFVTDGVRCYIYDKSSDNILESEVFEGKKAIDFLGYRYSGDTTVYDFTVSHVDGADINTTTAFGNIESTDEIELSMDYPFEFDGIQYYYAHYIYDGVAELDGEHHYNEVVSGTQITNAKLKENTGEELMKLLYDYWGESVASEFKRNSNLMFITEPIFIVSYATGEETTDTDEFDNGAFYYQSDSVTNDYEVEKYVYFTAETKQDCLNGRTRWIYENGETIAANVQDVDTQTALEEIRNIVSETQYEDIVSDYQDDYIDHFEKAVWYEEYSETTNYYRQYKYAYGTARSVYEQCQNGLEAASNYQIADSVCDAVYCKEIGENGEYNAEYPLIFPDDPDTEKPTYGGDENVLEVNGTKTTWGMSILASKEFNESIWHTNKYTTGEPSGVPADDVTNYPNDNGHPYGNNVVEKIYEIRDII